MKILPFTESKQVSIGMELEFQIIDPKTFGLISRSKDLLQQIKESRFKSHITPEITQGMIEVNSSIHHSVKEMHKELLNLRDFILLNAKKIPINFCGGGAHPFHKWAKQKIFPSARYKNLSKKFRYLTKFATVFGQHVHIGCKSGDDAIYLTHALARYVPQLIAMCASSPFYQENDTGYFSSRLNIFSAFPLTGVMPYLTSWEQFSEYFYKMRDLEVIQTMKDFYWDVRPKPEFGTVEIRVCDTPLTIKKALTVTAYVQALAFYLLEERPFLVCPDLYYLYNHNKFQASRYGFEGTIIEPATSQAYLISEDIANTLKKIERYANQLDNMGYISKLMDEVANNQTDTKLLRKIYKETNSFAKVVEEQCKLLTADA